MCATAKLLAVDGLNIVRRIFEAIPVPDPSAKLEGALLSAKRSLMRAINEHAPTHAAIAFDLPAPTWRHALYPEYQAKRKPMPKELQDALPAFKASLREELGLLVLDAEGFEAEDIIASLTRLWVGGEAVVLSNDKDLCALIPQGVRVYDHFGEVWRTAEWVQAKYDVSPSQMQDYLALTGDAVDGVPGVPKIGAKTAAALLREHGSLEGILQAAESNTDAKLKRVLEHKALALLSRQLVTLRDDLSFGLSWKMARVALP